MKILMINGSPHKNGCTFTALNEIAKTLDTEGVTSEIVHIGTKIEGCRACYFCKKNGKCIVEDDLVNEVAQKVTEADGVIFGSPVHYAGASGAITAFLDRLYFSAGSALAYKPGAAVVSCRRAGSTAALEQLQKYFTINNQPLVSSQYWAMVHGGKAEEVAQDAEGMQTMRQIGRNMAWLIKSIAQGRDNGIKVPATEERVWTNFIK